MVISGNRDSNTVCIFATFLFVSLSIIFRFNLRSVDYSVRSDGKPGRCFIIADRWDFFMHYKTTVFIGIVSILGLLFFSASIIYMALQSSEFAGILLIALGNIID